MPDDSPSPTGLVDEIELRSALAAELSEWCLHGNALERTVRLPDFLQAMQLVHQVGERAEALQHHPDIDIRYNRVRFLLTSHDAGGITRRDLRLAGVIDELISQYEDQHRAA